MDDWSSKKVRTLRDRRRRYYRGNYLSALLGWFLVGVVGMCILAVLATPLVIHSLPPRYVERFVPEPLRVFAANYRRDFVVLPTPEVTSVQEATSLLGNISATPIPTALGEDAGASATVASSPTGTPVLAATPTPAASPTPPPTPTVTFTPSPTVEWLPSSHILTGFTQVYQTWNNCGPATLTMGLMYWGWDGNQALAASYLKPDPEDKNVSPYQMADFVTEHVDGLVAVYRIGGDLEFLKRMVYHGYPVLVETGYEPDGYDWMGHYRLVMGYDDLEQLIYVYDSFLGRGQAMTDSYDEFDRVWQHFNRTVVVIYPPEREAEVADLMGELWTEEGAALRALEVARREAAASPQNGFAWFNLGTAFTMLGRYEEAAVAYDEARLQGLPWRMLWYQFGPFEAYYQVGRYDDVLALAAANENTTPYVEETYYYRGLVYLAQGQYSDAIAQFNLALRHNRNFDPAQRALEEAQALAAAQ